MDKLSFATTLTSVLLALVTVVAATHAETTDVHAPATSAYSLPLSGLDSRLAGLFAEGRDEFSARWVLFPLSGGHWGRGPQSNADSCAQCHVANGRGRAPDHEREAPRSMVLRLSVPGKDAVGGPRPHPAYGEQLNNTGVLGRLLEEGEFRIGYDSHSVRFADGETVELRQPRIRVASLWYGPLGKDTMLSARIAQPVFGAGLLEAVSERTILAIAGRQRALGFGGRPNYVWDRARSTTAIGRFGHKAAQPTLYQQVASAFIVDMGVTSRLFPEEDCWPAQRLCYGIETVPGFEAQDRQLEAIVAYLRMLAPPAQRDSGRLDVRRGEALFERLRCAVCHVPQLETAAESALPILGNRIIRPYTDLLLHDLGDDLADGREEYLAGPRDWRTSPLWGLGLRAAVNHNANLLHDGRARNVTEAILWHGGEAAASRDAFLALPETARRDLLHFLESL